MTDPAAPPPAAPRPVPPRRPQFILWVLMALVVAVLVIATSGNEGGRLLGFKNADLAELGYLIVILIFVGSALLGRGLGAGEVVRATAGWLAVLLILVGVYAYRVELAGVGARVLGVLAPGVPISGRLSGEPGETVVIVRAIDGHFGVNAELNGVPLALVVDTGASFVTLTVADAAGIGVDIGSLHFTTPIRTANGVIQAAPITINTIRLGTIDRTRVPALVAPPDSLDESLLGLSFLNTLARYAVAGDRLVLTP